MAIAEWVGVRLPFRHKPVDGKLTGSQPQALFLKPYLGEVLADVVAGRHVPAFEFFRSHDNAIPPQERYGEGLGQGMTLEFPHYIGALPHIRADRLADEEGVEITVGRARMVERRQIPRDVARELDRRIVEIVGGEIDCASVASMPPACCEAGRAATGTP